MQYNGRFKDAPWYNGCLNEIILVVGMGGIGGNSMYNLSKTIPCTYYIIDQDTVEEINIGSQLFKKSQVGKSKVQAIMETCEEFSIAKVLPFLKKYSNEYRPITITGLDNMKTRREVFEEWRKHEDREILIEARLRANLYEIYAVTKGKEEDYEKTLFEDSEVSDGPCTFKQTAYFGMLVGARITHILVNYLTNKYSKEEICTIPFFIQEYGEPFYINVK